MTDAELDQSYSALCAALSQAGQAQAPLFLSVLCLSMVARMERADEVLGLIDNAKAQCGTKNRTTVRSPSR